jgi:transcriptional regulator with XRE-family HTH domain
MNLGKTILDLRKKKNITQDELAAELGVTAAAVSKWENNYTLPDILMLCALADYFQVSTDELLDRKPNKATAVIVTDPVTLGDRVQELLNQHKIEVKEFCTDFRDGMDKAYTDHSITHFFYVYVGAEIQKIEFKDARPDVTYYFSNGETQEEAILSLQNCLNKALS